MATGFGMDTRLGTVRRLTVASGLAVSGYGVGAAQAQTLADEGYDLIWQDEFSGTENSSCQMRS